MATIPKIIHQIWIGPHTPPTSMMTTWHSNHPDFEYILWTEDEVRRRGFVFKTQAKMDIMKEYCGIADLMRYEILYEYGGVFVDADSICLNPFDDYFMLNTSFLTFENENVRKGLISNGTIGFIKGHPLMRDIIDWILTPESTSFIQKYRAWYSVGPQRLTELIKTNKYLDMLIYPSYCFLPHHFTGDKYLGHKKIYAYQEWGTAKQLYDKTNKINEIVVPDDLMPPMTWVSVLIPSWNTPMLFVQECLESIMRQTGHFGMEIVWINDGSSDELSGLLEKALATFEMRSRFIKVKYIKFDTNYGICVALNRGVTECSWPIIIRMDSDDIMVPTRIQTQIEYMSKNPECVICGTGMILFEERVSKTETETETEKHPIMSKVFPRIQTIETVNNVSKWILNHPTVCFRKKAILNVGNYINIQESKTEDYDLWIRILETYSEIHSLPDILLYYRIHNGQITNVKYKI